MYKHLVFKIPQKDKRGSVEADGVQREIKVFLEFFIEKI
jgi:hypothetical protein